MKRRDANRLASLLAEVQTAEVMVWVFVRRLLDDGEDVQAIARLLDVSEATVYRRLNHLGMTRGRWGHGA